jgi:sterol desaturase/sphingolipid hydroxylase (fatty acid hydroxylase superfamily)
MNKYKSLIYSHISSLNYSNTYSQSHGLYNNILKFISVNFILGMSMLLGGVIINYKTNDCIIRTVLTFVLITFWTYIVHVAMHIYKENPIGKMHDIHHNSLHKGSMSADIFEILVNIIIIGGVIWIPIMMGLEKYTGCRLTNNYIILIWALVFTTYHLVNYHQLNDEVHKQHHKEDGKNNYGPEWFDILFHTKAEHSNIEDMNSGIINMVIATLGVLSVKDTPYDIVQIIKNKIY